MATLSYLMLSPPSTSPLKHLPKPHSFLSSVSHPTTAAAVTTIRGRRRVVSGSLLCGCSKKNQDSADGGDRLISAICYFYPFFDGIQYGKYVISQFAPLQVIIHPLIPAIRAFKSFPFNGFLVFLTLYFVVVRNPNFSRFVRFNTMQAIVLDVLLIFPDLLDRTFNPKAGFGLDLLMSLDSTVFLFLLVSLIYASSSCAFGLLPRLPIVADAADRQLP
ncbi:hypothetical protein vseg_010021 [Gypsophila vaccaria]